ncbi:MAG TPA: 16S rRNA (guanine(527)-N(7))-methyltransferase RsmG [Chloroflexota bacterium]|nr:16S rRNA (guanine(527)-N(7))-methyltransferase RsmG [Chloroflexota bacterium]
MADLESACSEAVGKEVPAGCHQLGVSLSQAQLNLLAAYCALLLVRNQTLNLTALRDPYEVARRHFLDALTLMPAIQGEQAAVPLSVVDVGSGAGLPGMVLAIAQPEWRVTLVESNGKKAAFMQATAEKLHIGNVTVIAERAETVGRSDLRDHFDLAVARAVASTPVLVEYCAPLVRPRGQIALYKSGDADEETGSAAEATAALSMAPMPPLPVPRSLGLGEDRFLLRFEKRGPTPDGFPRRPGVARRRPL